MLLQAHGMLAHLGEGAGQALGDIMLLSCVLRPPETDTENILCYGNPQEYGYADAISRSLPKPTPTSAARMMWEASSATSTVRIILLQKN